MKIVGLLRLGALVALAFGGDIGHAVEPLYAGSKTCAGCHAAEYRAWSESDHAQAMALATDANVRGNFNDARFVYAGISTRFFRRDGKFLVATDGADGKIHEFEIAYTFGVHPLQQYLIAFPQGRLQTLSIAWDSRPASAGGQRWFHLYPQENITSTDPLHWTGPYQRWNSRCADCHSTGLERGFDPVTGNYQTRWQQINVGCEACHGPASLHVAKAERGAKGGLSVDPGHAGSWHFEAGHPIATRSGAAQGETQLAVCGPCHSRRVKLAEPAPGKSFLDAYAPALLDAGLYFADGQIRDEVYEYGSFLQSKMAQRGVVCADCHDAHSMRLKQDGNGVCGQCHLAQHYDAPAHHHHAAGSAGALCANCHMPTRTYMGVDQRRDHGIRAPDPWLSREAETPNACTTCHAGRDNDWAIQTLQGWGKQRHVDSSAERLAHTRMPTPDAPRTARTLAADTAVPPLVRATVLSELRVASDDDLNLLALALRDADPQVRLGAAGAFAGVPGEYTQAMLWPRLGDPVRAVRFEALQQLAAIPEAQLIPAQRDERQRVLAEFEQSSRASNDLAAGPMSLAAVYTALGRMDAAETNYRQALRLEPSFVPGWLNLADLYRATGREDEAGKAIAHAMTVDANVASVHHALGLHRIRTGDRQGAMASLRRAHELEPANTRYAYVLGVALNDAGNTGEAISVMEAASRRDPANPDLLQLLLSLYQQQGRVEDVRWVMEQMQGLKH